MTQLPGSTHEADEIVWEVHDALRRLARDAVSPLDLDVSPNELNELADKLTTGRWRPVLPEPNIEEWAEALQEQTKHYSDESWSALAEISKQNYREQWRRLRDRAYNLAAKRGQTWTSIQ